MPLAYDTEISRHQRMKRKNAANLEKEVAAFFGVPEEIRTPDPTLRRTIEQFSSTAIFSSFECENPTAIELKIETWFHPNP